VQVGIPWYRDDDWNALCAVFADRHDLHDDFRDWRRAAEKLEKQLRKSGHIVERVHIDPSSFPLWCAARGLNVDAKARSRFASEFVSEKYRNAS
jgi:hypothetical protein